MKKKAYFCDECGYDTMQWLGKCPACGSWNTFKEITINTSKKKKYAVDNSYSDAIPLNSIGSGSSFRISSGSSELDRVLGGGIVKGGVLLFSGEPGIGKSTILLQTAGYVSSGNGKVLYVSAEESAPQVKERSIRLGVDAGNIFITPVTEISRIISLVERLKPELVIVDSIQAVYDEEISSSPGSIVQVRESSLKLSAFARNNNLVLFLIGHVTKDGILAGPRMLEHMVDVVLYFEGDRYESYRVIRAVKNRYGMAGEVGFFEMTDKGVVDIVNPSEVFLSSPHSVPGVALSVVMEGRRPFIAEIQSLVNKTSFNNPVRRVLGSDLNKLSLIVAVLEKKLGIKFFNYDIFLKSLGGIRIVEPAIDLAMASSIFSGYENLIIPKDILFIGEIGLGGEVRNVKFIGERISEAERLNYKAVVIPAAVKKAVGANIRLIKLDNVSALPGLIGKISSG